MCTVLYAVRVICKCVLDTFITLRSHNSIVNRSNNINWITDEDVNNFFQFSDIQLIKKLKEISIIRFPYLNNFFDRFLIKLPFLNFFA